MAFKIIPKRALSEKLGGRCNSSIYNDIERGLLPKQIKLSERSVGWIEQEIDAVIAARVMGKSNEEIRTLVEKLHANRLVAS